MAINPDNVYDISDLVEGETVVGRVQSIADFGAFIEVGPVTGLLHISNMSWEHVDDIEDIVQVDDYVEVKILRVDAINDRVEFGLKQLQPRLSSGRRGGEGSVGQAARAARFQELVVGQVLEGRIKRVAEFGIFVDLDGIDGLVPNREVSWDYIEDIREHFHEGDAVRVAIVSLDAAKQRISLSIRQLTERPKPVEREMANAVDKAELRARDAGDDEIRGDIYIRFASDDVEQRMPERVRLMVASHAGSFRGNAGTDAYEQISSVLFEESVSRVYFVSNASTNVPRNCRERSCPLGDAVENCALARSCCSVVILRPACDTPRMEELFPGNEVLGIMAYVQQCPHHDNGAVLAIFGLTWMPKCDRRPFETRMSGRMIWSATRSFDRRPGNAFNAQMIERLSPISVITKRNLATWQDYLDWRNALLAFKKIGVRYLSRRFDAKNRTVVFTVVCPHDPNRFWLREDVCVVPLKNSVDQWQYREDSADDVRKKRTRPIALGELAGKDVVRSDVELTALKAAKCPWDAPYIADVPFSLDDDLLDEIVSQFDDSASDEEVTKYVENRFTLPETGFLMVSAVGDESLIRRQQKALEIFAKEGSVAAPFLTSYLFDITKARVPEAVPQITDFLKKDLNESQKQAVSMMVAAPDIALIQGPPGTGKTTVIAEGIWQFVKQGKRVLLVSQSGAAVDNALDRLENIPAIRAIRLKKETAYSRNANDGGRYAKDSVLGNFYLTLAKSANAQLEYWREAEGRIRMLSDAQTDLANFIDRLSREDNVMVGYRQEAETATRDLDQANQELSARRASAVEARQVFEFVEFLKGSEFPSTLCGVGVAVPQVIVSGFENVLRDELEALSKLGAQLFVTPYNLEWPASQKMQSVKYALEQLRVLRQDVLPACAADIARLKGQVGEEVVADSVALQIADLKRELEEVERREDDETDEVRLNELGRRRRELRKQIGALKSSSGFSVEQYRRVLNVPDAEARDVVDWLSKPERKRMELVEFLEKWRERILPLVGRIEAAEKLLIENLSTAAKDSADVADAERTVAQCQRKVADIKDKIREVDNRCAPVRDGLKRAINLLSQRTGMSFPDGNGAREWCQAEVKRLQEGLSATAAERKWREPLLNAWVERLGQVSKSDEDLVLSDYLKSCSVVGMTCTSDNNLLVNNGYDHFDVVIIDEVSKATPPELLMSMVLAEKTILVGDHRQLPPLFGDKEPKGLSEIMQQQEEESVPEAQRITKESFRKYQGMVEASLFKQHFEQADDHLKARLWYQYRMHPDIEKLVNLFYENKLVCGIDNPDEARNHLQSAERVPWMRHNGHAYWIDSSEDPDGIPFWEVSRMGSTSKENPLEVKLMFKALDDLDASLDAYARTLPPDLAKNVKKTVGIISFYGLQARALTKEFNRHRFKRLKCRKPATVDRFQGQECDYILVSMTRNPAQKLNLSHVAKFERINVAFSRARELLLIFGARNVFVDCDVWLPPLDRPGKAEREPVYRRMVDLLTREGRFLSSRDLISREQWKSIAPAIVRGEDGFESGAWQGKHTVGGRRFPGGGKGRGHRHFQR